jgi:hypothetical protein
MDEATKKYLDEKFEGLATKEEIASIAADLATVVSTQSELMTLIDKRFDALEDKLDATVNQVSGHEKRITFLEAKVLQG